MRAKKTAQLAYRLTAKEKSAVEKSAARLHMKPAELVSLVVSQFVDAHENHGKKLIWPPEFNYFPNGKTKQDHIKPKKN